MLDELLKLVGGHDLAVGNSGDFFKNLRAGRLAHTFAIVTLDEK